jgi:hypothetical protein
VYICCMRNEQINQIKQDLMNGVQYGNDLTNWFSVVNVDKNRFMLNIQDEMKFYKNLDSVAKRINQLINKGV